MGNGIGGALLLLLLVLAIAALVKWLTGYITIPVGRCGTATFRTTGTMTADRRTIVVTGDQPQFDKHCTITSTTRSGFDFRRTEEKRTPETYPDDDLAPALSR